ncbi:hypothetical protein QVD17_16893 [Tagetes erecta]|uniref:Non-specific lipid-transfer protein n=1 Tax=Tagetes erecta TaxID=13708 RepID=A0AAD8KVN8_TARER|nr:hypothetical protein QVD17_16893 [Tagetes erecta]
MFKKVSCMLVLLVLLVAMTTPEVEAVTCGQVTGAIAPCLGYLRNGGNPPKICCDGLKSGLKSYGSPADLKAICICLKSSSSSYRGVSGIYAAMLPGKCDINVPYKISPSTDCNRIQ